MKGHPCKSFLKSIRKDRSFNVEFFVTSGLGEFLKQAKDYLYVIYDECKKTGKIKKTMKKKYSSLMSALDRILPVVKRQNLKPETTALLADVFAVFFHPQSPEMYRKYALKMFIRIFPIFEVSDLPALKPILQTVVPWVRFSSDQEEKQLFLLIVHDICPIVSTVEGIFNSLTGTL